MLQAIGYAREIVAALEFMHERGVVHRDIKPDNVCLADDGSCRLIDFGHAAFVKVRHRRPCQRIFAMLCDAMDLCMIY
jgi:serine/threonine protein kinase